MDLIIKVQFMSFAFGGSLMVADLLRVCFFDVTDVKLGLMGFIGGVLLSLSVATVIIEVLTLN